MGEVAIRYKVMPDPNVEINTERMVTEIEAIDSDSATVQEVETKPLAFGLSCVELAVIIEDAEGMLDAFEDLLKSIEGVGEIQVLEMGRLL